ncbi:hypothetical protein PIB30_061134 [Stylosanthes scabra]|uniref:Aminotransferase-like plant mobile domain-containing protein n=1 Tax=Stylosanthes scabra TaxID=79078 RepID=A0ABU6RL22_9FABA|nr:hypothetical protein [Stylosanthes scabra]
MHDSLLSWAYHRIPACRCVGFEQRYFPLAKRWIGYEPPRDREETKLRGWRRILNRLGIADVVWTPYADPLLQPIIPPWLVQSIGTWHVVCPLFCFPIVEWHQVDRVVRQFGSRQHIPSQPLNIDEMHVRDGRWGKGEWYPDFLQGLSGVVLPVGKSGPCWTGGRAGSVCAARSPSLPVYDLPAPQLHQPEDGHLPEVRPRRGRQIRVRNRRGAGRGRGQGPEQEPAQEQPVHEPPVPEPPVQEPPVHPSEAGPSHGGVHGSPTDWYQSFIGDPQAASSAQAVAFTPLSFQAPRRVDESTSSESTSHGDLRGSMRPYMSDTSSDAPGDDPPLDRGRRVRRPPACGTGGCLEAPPARRGRRSGRHGE